MQVVTSNMDGRMVNERAIEIPRKNKFQPSESNYVKLGQFTGNDDYNVNLPGPHKTNSRTVCKSAAASP